jgi:hypothetical protein
MDFFCACFCMKENLGAFMLICLLLASTYDVCHFTFQVSQMLSLYSLSLLSILVL